MFTQPEPDETDIRRIVEERYGMQYAAIEVISSQYLGPRMSHEIRTPMNDFRMLTADKVGLDPQKNRGWISRLFF